MTRNTNMTSDAATDVAPPASYLSEKLSHRNETAFLISTEETVKNVRIPYALRRVPLSRIVRTLPLTDAPQTGDIVLARLEKIGKNARLELANGRPCTLHAGDELAVVFG